MGTHFNPEPGIIEMYDWYSNNEVSWRELKFSIPIEKWSEFERSQVYRDLNAYVETLRTQDIQDERPAPERIEETEQSAENSRNQGCFGSFWDQVRRGLRRKKSL